MTPPRNVSKMLTLTAVLTALAACSEAANAPPLLTISPWSPEVWPGETVQFNATGVATGPVEWAVAEADGGTIDEFGVYTAPAAEGTFTVTASLASIAETRTTPVRVNRNVRVAVGPSTATVAAGASIALAATVSGPVKTVTWSVAEGSGTVTADGLYTAPATPGTYTVVATSTADRSKSGTATITVTSAAEPPPVTEPPPVAGVGTGGAHAPQYAQVTGAGPMPSTAGAPVASCAGDGATDDTRCLQTAIDSAAAAGKPLLIPATASHYRITLPLKVKTSLIGTGGMPTIRTTTTGSGYDERGAILWIAASNLWVYNLHVAGTYGGGGATTGAQSAGPNISLGNVSNITIKGNKLEGAQGDSISDHYQEMDGGSGGVKNVLVANNDLIRPYRCCISLVALADRWAIMDNVCNKGGNDSSSPFDWEPWRPESYITNIELGYNHVTVWQGSNPESPPINVNGWFDPTPGGNIYVHHNYGSWPNNNYGGFVGRNGNWFNVVTTSNAQGSSPAM